MTFGDTIKQLLEERERVILPGFGNLEVKESGGGRFPSGKRIDPPGLIIRFDSSYSKDDGLLATRYSQLGEPDKEEAEQQILELVDAIRFALDKGESYPLNDAGIFSRDDEGKVHFQPNPLWVLEPDQYGLGSMELLELDDLVDEEGDSFEISTEELDSPDEGSLSDIEEETIPEDGTLLELSEEEEVETEAAAPEDTPSKPVAKLVTSQAPKPLNKRISNPKSPGENEESGKRSGLWRIIWLVAGLLIIVLVVLLIIPSDKAAPTVEQETERPLEQDQIPEPDQAEIEKELTPAVEVVDEHHFFIIAGSFRNLVNASELQDKLKENGYPAEVMITENRMYRVIVATYATSGEAERDLADLKTQAGLESCWLLVNE